MKTFFRWTDHAKADLRRVDRKHAIEILRSLSDYVNSGVGDYRVRFEVLEANTLRILQVKHRGEAYR